MTRGLPNRDGEPFGSALTRRTALLRMGGAALGLGALCLSEKVSQAHSPNKFYQGALPYDFSALQGFLSAEAVESHYRHHHRPLVDRANEILEETARARAEGRFADLPGYNDVFTASISGHVLHTTYWHSMSPYGGGDPSGDVGTHISEHFGSPDAFRAHFAAMAKAMPESGWTVLVWEPNSSRMLLVNLTGEAGPFFLGSFPLLALDLHEHAYYPDYGHRRDDYVDKFLEVLDWDFLAVQLKRAH